MLDATLPAALFDAAGRVDVLVNNAAHCELPDTIAEVRADSLDRHFAVNTQASAMLMAEFVRRYKARAGRTGRIVNVSTDAIEVGHLGITVNAIAPGPVQTGWIGAELEAQVLPAIPLARLGTPMDIADAIVFLASKQAGWITGQVIQVAGPIRFLAANT